MADLLLHIKLNIWGKNSLEQSATETTQHKTKKVQDNCTKPKMAEITEEQNLCIFCIYP